MKTSMYGQVSQPVMALVGVWDPFLPDHRQLFEQLVQEARARSRSPLAILIDPAPQMIMYGPSGWALYDDFDSRRELMLSFGLEAVMHLHFSRADLKAGAAEFLELIFAQIPLAELWLGKTQRLGSGPEGSPEAVAELAEEYGLYIKRLPEKDLTELTRQIRSLLGAGRVAEAQRLVGCPPVFHRPPEGDGKLEMAWKPGAYKALAVQNPARPGDGPELEITLTVGPERERYFIWPDRNIEYLAFIAGPGDES
jgi:FAD synthase